jgi:hypothetical protein
MSRDHIRHQADDGTWLQRVNAAIQAVKALYQTVSEENGNTGILIRQLGSLKAARAAWQSGDRDRARELLTAALNAGDGEPAAAEGTPPPPSSLNGQAGAHHAPPLVPRTPE